MTSSSRRLVTLFSLRLCSVRQVLFVYCALFLLLACNLVSSSNYNLYLFNAKPSGGSGSHMCPTCDMVDSRILHRITSCEQFNDTQTAYARSTPHLKSLPSYKCQCSYLKESNCQVKESSKSMARKTALRQAYVDSPQPPVNIYAEDDAISDEDDELNQEIQIEYEANSVDCLVAHVGMSIKGNNLLHKKWKDKEDCFNLCLKTTIKNGHPFDCKSFEHWHKDCNAQMPPPSSIGEQDGGGVESTCATFSMDAAAKRSSYFDQQPSNHVHHNNNFGQSSSSDGNNKRQARAKYKMDICVLSNQTIQLAGPDFVPNSGVTYYEILCQRPVHKAPNKKQQQHDTGKMASKNGRPVTKQVVETTTSVIIPTTTVAIKKSTNHRSSPRTKAPKTTKGITVIEDDATDIENNQKTSNNHEQQSKSKNGGNKIPKNIVTGGGGGSTKTPGEGPAHSASSKKCHFNPCKNDGACVLVETNRFECKCKPFFYGIYCEYPGIQKFCHKHFMEIVLFQEIANDLRIKITDIYINDKKTAQSHSHCRLSELNSTHASFKIPYQKCSTQLQTNDYELVATNRLLSSAELGQEFRVDHANHHLINEYVCRVDQSLPEPSSKAVTARPSGSGDQAPCVISLLNLSLKMFQDETYTKEILIDSANLVRAHKPPTFKYDQQIFIQFSVEYSDRLDQLDLLQDRLQYFHLTIQRCWLTKTQNENRHILQTLIDNGCPKRRVSFYDTSSHRNAIRFSFHLSDDVKRNIEPQFYIHCLPEICTDPPKNSTDLKFYSQFKSCHNISHPCNLDPSAHPNDLLNDNRYNSVESKESAAATSVIAIGPGNCYSKLGKGPVIINDNVHPPGPPGYTSRAVTLSSGLLLTLVAIMPIISFLVKS